MTYDNIHVGDMGVLYINIFIIQAYVTHQFQLFDIYIPNTMKLNKS